MGLRYGTTLSVRREVSNHMYICLFVFTAVGTVSKVEVDKVANSTLSSKVNETVVFNFFV